MSQEDYHIHCEYSDDSVYPMEQVVKDAIDLGLSEICFTDHVDYGVKTDWDVPLEYGPDGKPKERNVDYPKYFAQLNRLAEKYSSHIQVKKGLEMGIQRHTVPDFQKLYDWYADDLDFVILSCHQVNDQEFWTGEFQEGRSVRDYTRAYYSEILECMKLYSDYSVLGHLDMIIRYDKSEHCSFEEVKDLITEILKLAIDQNKGIELNTSSVRYRIRDLTPSREILKLYHDLGGRIITIGSDSHAPDQLGAYIQEQKEELKKPGFTEYCTFEKMKPIFHPL